MGPNECDEIGLGNSIPENGGHDRAIICHPLFSGVAFRLERPCFDRASFVYQLAKDELMQFICDLDIEVEETVAVVSLRTTAVEFLRAQDRSVAPAPVSVIAVRRASPSVAKLDQFFLFTLDRRPALTSLDPACFVFFYCPIVVKCEGFVLQILHEEVASPSGGNFENFKSRVIHAIFLLTLKRYCEQQYVYRYQKLNKSVPDFVESICACNKALCVGLSEDDLIGFIYSNLVLHIKVLAIMEFKTGNILELRRIVVDI
ncbi:hypothetical protein PR048_004874 [Dryococelus australis]|uniref:Uncharacterized protein n=1 Tax=Dryococelus australis TaxID=614101 RepID=A0ABQ9I6M2_9NEOP|nr:hypothetical protein PR048_004874 [Dryococelus australis]